MADDMKPPPGWGHDELTGHLDEHRRNQYATFHRKPIVRDLIEIDRLFRMFLVGMVNPRPWFPVRFMLRAHSAFLAASGAAMAGQVYEVSAQLRSCIELAGYGLFIGDDSGLAEVWERRHDDEASMAACKSAFTVRAVKEHVRSLAPKIADSFDALYGEMIDYGGHPNERGFSISTSIVENSDHMQINAIYLQGDGIALDWGLKKTAQVGLWALLAFQLLYRDRFRLLGITDAIEQLRQRY